MFNFYKASPKAIRDKKPKKHHQFVLTILTGKICFVLYTPLSHIKEHRCLKKMTHQIDGK